MHPDGTIYLQALIKAFEDARNEQKALEAKRYLKNQFEFLGLGTTVRRTLMKEFFTRYGYPVPADLKSFSLYLWDKPEREYQHTVLDVLHKMAKKLEKKDIQWLEILIRKKSWWDTVDGLSAWVIGIYFQKFPEQIQPVTRQWMDSGNMWLQRVSLLFQLFYKEHTDTVLLASYIEQLADHKDFFIRKAIGWILRQYSKTNPEWVREFIDGHMLSGLSVREGSKYISRLPSHQNSHSHSVHPPPIIPLPRGGWEH